MLDGLIEVWQVHWLSVVQKRRVEAFLLLLLLTTFIFAFSALTLLVG